MQKQQEYISLLINRGDYKKALTELERAIQRDPEEPWPFAMTGLCYMNLDEYKKARPAIETAISLNPEEDYYHYLLALYYNDTNQPIKATDLIKHCLSINPYKANYYALLASLQANRNLTDVALRTVNEGLAQDPENAFCLRVKSAIEPLVNKKVSSVDSASEYLNKRPADSNAHATMGYAQLSKHNHHDARKSFLEALRINPNNEWARQGLLNALHSKFFLFRPFFMFFLWAQKNRDTATWILLAIGYALGQLMKAAENFETIQTGVIVVVFIYVFFLLSTWMIVPLMNLILLIAGKGRLYLRQREIVHSTLIGIFLLLAFGTCVLALSVDVKLAAWSGYFFLSCVTTEGLINYKSYKYSLWVKYVSYALVLTGLYCCIDYTVLHHEPTALLIYALVTLLSTRFMGSLDRS